MSTVTYSLDCSSRPICWYALVSSISQYETPALAPLNLWLWHRKPWEHNHVDFAGLFQEKMLLVVMVHIQNNQKLSLCHTQLPFTPLLNYNVDSLHKYSNIRNNLYQTMVHNLFLTSFCNLHNEWGQTLCTISYVIQWTTWMVCQNTQEGTECLRKMRSLLFRQSAAFS